jgi:hypothetical protein
MSWAARLGMAGVSVCLPLLSGCILFPFMLERDRDRDRDPDWDRDRPPPTSTPQAPQQAPSFASVGIPDWPPLGPTREVSIDVRDPDADLWSLDISFKNQFRRTLSGSRQQVVVTGEELGEGFGKLAITATDSFSNRGHAEVSDLLVDLTPPKITLGQTVLPADGVLELWVGDAWILGSVTLEFSGRRLVHEFPPGYPPTLGKTWDYSLVKFVASELPPSEGSATLTALDAAGNSATETFSLVIDATPPAVAILSPLPDATLSGSARIEVSAGDAGGGPVWIDVALGGTPVGSASGPRAELTVDLAEFVAGPTTLTATAVDRAGNTSEAEISVVIE